MGQFVKGDVVVVPFPFSDLSASKRRPALVLVDLVGDDLILCQITSQTISDIIAVSINPADFESGGLNLTSNARPNKLFTADENIVLYRAGRLNAEMIDEIISRVIKMFKGDNNNTEEQDKLFNCNSL